MKREIRIEVTEPRDKNGEQVSYSFPIHCPNWLFKILCWLEK